MREYLSRYRAIICMLFLVTAHGCCPLGDMCPSTPVTPPEPPPPPPPPPSASALGTNVGAVEDWSTEIAFVDAFKMSRPWISGAEGVWDDGRALDLDAQGWVKSLAEGQMARTLTFWYDGYPAYEPGEFVVTYEGEGEVTYFGPTDIVSRAPGRDVLRMDPTKGGLGMNIMRTNPANYIRNIQIRAIADEKSTALFAQPFLDNLKGLSVVRLMTWGSEGATAKDWEHRPKPSDARWSTPSGVPVETLVALANEAKIDPWLCVPYWADDAWVRKYAELVKATLAPERKVYVEHSNEVWNAMFPSFHHALARARENPGRFGGPENEFGAMMNYHAARSAEIFKIWEEVFGGSERLVRVFGAWAAVEWTSRDPLAFENARQHIDAVAIAPYFGGYLGTPEEEARVAKLTLDELIAELDSKAIPEALSWVRQHHANTKAAGLSLIAYEGGQHLVGVGRAIENPDLNALFNAANADARMKTMYLKYLSGWREAGGELFVNFSSVGGMSKFGRWGVRPDLLQPAEKFPKAAALIEFAAKNPRWW